VSDYARGNSVDDKRLELAAAVGSVGGVVNALDFNVKIKNTAAHDP
jgi:hypothetical protein